MTETRTTIGRRRVAPTPDELLARAEELVPFLRASGARADRMGRLPDETITAFEDAGFFEMIRPVHRGGYGSDPATIARFMTVVASGCASTAWVMTIYANFLPAIESLPEETVRALYSVGPHPKFAGVFGKPGARLRPVPGGFQVNGRGRWAFNSGCHHADWDVLRVHLEQPDGSLGDGFCIVPLAELTICDDWSVMGASGTGSCSVECGELFVPDARVSPMTDQARAIFYGDLAAALITTLPLGMTRHALDVFRDEACTHGIGSLGHARMIDAPVVQAAVGTAAVNIALMEGYQHSVLSRLRHDGSGLGNPLLHFAGASGCYRLARQAIEGLFDVSRSDDIRLDRPIQRVFRDLQVFLHQANLAPYASYEKYGKQVCDSWVGEGSGSPVFPLPG